MEVLLYILFFFLVLIKFFGYKDKIQPFFFKNFLGIFFFIFIFWNLDYFDDKYNYSYMFNNIDDYKTDFVFRELVKISHLFNFDFQDLYNFHIIIIACFAVTFISKFTNNILFVLIIIITYRFVDYGNQIRYYMGFFIALHAIYYAFNAQKYKYIALSILAILSHSSLIIICIIPFFKHIFLSFTPKKVIIINLVLFISLSLLVSVISYIFPQFIKYFVNESGKSSLLGGLFDLFPIILICYSFFKNHEYIKRRISFINNDSSYRFLYILSSFSFAFISCGILFRIVADRFVYSFSVVWLCYLFYSLKYYDLKLLTSQRLKIVSIFVVLICWFYFSPLLFLDNSFYLNEALKMLNISVYE